MDERIGQLESAYCPPLDPALLSAILSDFDLDIEEDLVRAKETLAALKASALEQDGTEFDPSGTSAPGDVSNAARPESCPEASRLSSEDTDLTSLSNGFGSASIKTYATDENDPSKATQSEYLVRLEEADETTKVQVLQDMFPAAKQYTIVHILKKSNGSIDRAMDELLNHAFFDAADGVPGEQRVMTRGVDAFYSEGNPQQRRGKGGKKGKRRIQSLDESRSTTSPQSTNDKNPWKTSSKDIEFISDRTKIPSAQVASIFYQNGASVPATIEALLTVSAAQHIDAATTSDDPTIQLHAFELGRDFPHIKSEFLTELIRLTNPSTAAAHELAKAMASQPAKQGTLEIIPVYAPINTDSDTDEASNAPWTTITTSQCVTPRRHNDPYTTEQANTYTRASHQAFAQASSAYRRGRSDHLMGATAGYYSQVGRDNAARAHEVTAEAADALVASQSSPGCVDLHGVSVKDAVRISRAKTEAWWRANGKRAMGVDGRVRREERDGSVAGSSEALTIVTGVGRHSKGGKGLLGPAIGKMLLGEGWEARCEEGVWVVFGRRRRR